jgi:hypothetical protein
MALSTKLGTGARNAACDAIVDLVDVGTPNGYIQVRTGAAPTNPGDANSGTLLATLTFGATAFGAAATGVATANSITSDSSADASGDAGHFRVFDGNDVCIFQGTAGNAGDTPNMTFDNKSIVAGGTVACSSMTLTVPQAGS